MPPHHLTLRELIQNPLRPRARKAQHPVATGYPCRYCGVWYRKALRPDRVAAVSTSPRSGSPRQEDRNARADQHRRYVSLAPGRASDAGGRRG